MAEFSKLSGDKGGLNESLAGFFRDMLEKDVVDAVMVPARQPVKGVTQTLIANPEECSMVDPFAPVVPVNSAKLVANLTSIPSGRPTAVVMRSCETRALTELVKLKQANMDDLVVIGIDCLGRYENQDFMKLAQDGFDTSAFLESALNGGTKQEVGIDLAPACKICEHPVADNVDIRLCVIGSGPGDVYIEWTSEKGEAVRGKLGMEKGVQELEKERTGKRDQKLSEMDKTVSDLSRLDAHLAGCINCYNCRVACPMCYCKECVFVTDTFRHPGDKYMSWSDRNGSVKMPADTMMYHLTRMLHMSVLCVGCGQCTSACPNGIELTELFMSMARKTQRRFDYEPGRSLEEPQPLSVFYDDEFTEVTGQVK